MRGDADLPSDCAVGQFTIDFGLAEDSTPLLTLCDLADNGVTGGTADNGDPGEPGEPGEPGPEPGPPTVIDVQGDLTIFGPEVTGALPQDEAEVTDRLVIEAEHSDDGAINVRDHFYVGTDPAVAKTAVVVEVAAGWAPFPQPGPGSKVTVYDGSFYFYSGDHIEAPGAFELAIGGKIIMDSAVCFPPDGDDWVGRDCNPFNTDPGGQGDGFTAEQVNIGAVPPDWSSWETEANDGSWRINLTWLDHLSQANAPLGYNIEVTDPWNRYLLSAGAWLALVSPAMVL